MAKAGKAGKLATSSVTPVQKGKAGKASTAAGATPKSEKKKKKTVMASDDQGQDEASPSQINCPGGYRVVAYRFGPDGTTRHAFVKAHSAKKNRYERRPHPTIPFAAYRVMGWW